MANVVPLDDYTGEWYPGFKPEFIEGPYIVDGTGPFTKEDDTSRSASPTDGC